MFNTLFESLLKEQTQPPTGGLSEAKESLGGGVSIPSFLWVRSERTSGASVSRFP